MVVKHPMILLVLFTPGLVYTFVPTGSQFFKNTPSLIFNKSEILNKCNNIEHRNWSRVLISKRSQLNDYPKPRKKHKRPPWYDLFEEEVEKEPLGPPCKLLAKDVIEGKRRLRFTLKKTQKQMYATIVDDVTKDTLCFMATNFRYLSHIFGTVPTKDPKILRNKGGNVKAAYELGKLIGRQALSRGISKVFFDRSGYRYHGRVEALAIGARKVGLDF